MNEKNRFDEYINAHPRQSLQLLVIALCLIWQSPVCVLGVALYLILAKLCRLPWWGVLIMGLFVAAIIMLIDAYYASHLVNLYDYLAIGFALNKIFWKKLITCHGSCAFAYLYQYATSYLFGLPLLFAGILSTIDLIQDNPHQKIIQALHKGKHVNDQKELTDKKVESLLKRLHDQSDGTVLGVSKYTGKTVVLPDYFVNQIVLVLGTTGGGKTITLRRFYKRAIFKGYPLIVVDGKPTDDNVAWLQQLSQKHKRPFYGFNCANYAHYDPLANGGYTELKDKMISLKDQWENDYYRSIAEDYLQTTFEALLLSKKSFDMKRVVECLNHDELLDLAREIENEALLKRVVALESYDRKDITGLQAHLNLLIHSELGQFFSKSENLFTLQQAIAEDAVVYFALPALRFPSFSKVLGKLVINDLKAVIDRPNSDHKRIFMVFDEFSVFAGEQVLNLVNMGRGKGVHAVFGTQGLADLNKVDENFKNQILNCANTLICHRLNDQESAETISAWMGTRDTFTVTAQIDGRHSDSVLGTVRADKGYIIHPESIKQALRTGEAFYASKVGRFQWDKVRVKL